MRLEALYFIGALAVTAIPLSAGAQSLPANVQPTTTNAQAANAPAQQCPPGYDFEPGGYTGGGTWRPPFCGSRSQTIDF